MKLRTTLPALAIALAMAAPWSARAADYACPAAMDGHKLLNWKMADERGEIPLREINGSADAHWTWSKGAAARIVCGYLGSSKTATVPVSRAASHCVNPEMSSAFHCN